MAFWTKVTYTRPNVLTPWFVPSDEVMAVINEWRTSDPAKITAYEISESGEKLKQYYKICFTSVDTSLGFDDTEEYKANEIARTNHLNANGITVELTQHGDSYPTE